MRKLLFVLLAMALVATMFVVPAVSNAAPEDAQLPPLPDGALGWTENGADLYDFSASLYRRVLLYPLYPRDSYPSFALVSYDFGDAEFYWAYQDLYGGLRPDQTIEPPVAPIPNDGSMVFSHWIDASGNIVDFRVGIPATNGVYRAVYVKKAPLPLTTTPSVSSSGEQSSDSGEDYFPPVTTTEGGGSNPGTTSTDAEASSPTDSTSAMTTKTATDLEEDDVPLGGVTTTTTAVTTASPSPTTLDDRGAADLPVTGLTANEVFWIGGGLIVLLGVILLVFNKKNESKMS